jgi:hypothetical protein
MFVNSGFIRVIPGITEHLAPRLIIATILAITLAMHGYMIGSLSKSGAVAAFFVGFATFGTSACQIWFYPHSFLIHWLFYCQTT